MPLMIDDVGVPITSMVSSGPSTSVKQMVDSRACNAHCVHPRERDVDCMLFVSLPAAPTDYRVFTLPSPRGRGYGMCPRYHMTARTL